MNGLPGPYIKFFLRDLGHEGTCRPPIIPHLTRTKKKKIFFCLGLNRMLDGFPTRAAWALCTFAYSAGPGSEPVLFEGRTDGKIVPARGPARFGWDPVFEAEDTGLT
jgi:inosine triphosphate pyrophosphatase